MDSATSEVARRRLLVAALGGVGLVALGGACAAPGARTPRPVAAGWTAPADMLMVIPAGTAAAQMRGEPAFSYPSLIEVAAGQAVAIRNEDVAMHYFFELPIAPGQTARKVFATPGQYAYNGMLSCSLADAVQTTTVRVAPLAR